MGHLRRTDFPGLFSIICGLAAVFFIGVTAHFPVHEISPAPNEPANETTDVLTPEVAEVEIRRPESVAPVPPSIKAPEVILPPRGRRVDARDAAVFEAVVASLRTDRPEAKFAVDRLTYLVDEEWLEEAPTPSECEDLVSDVDVAAALAEAVDEMNLRSQYRHDVSDLGRTAPPLILVDEGDFIWRKDIFEQAKARAYVRFSAVGYSFDGRFATVGVLSEVPSCSGGHLSAFELRNGSWELIHESSRGAGTLGRLPLSCFPASHGPYRRSPPKSDPSRLLKEALRPPSSR